ncbi:MAG TPA: hypothetical protein VFD85_00260 [Gemmatimonadales bacterium]|nr:hypothetical protein [Gemmatimonadales bacterium]
MRVLVTGAETPEGLAVIRALAQAGIDVVAAGDRRLSMGFASRYPRARLRYTPVSVSPRRAAEDIVDIIDRTNPDLVVPVGEDLLVTLNETRRRVTRHTILAAPPAEVLGRALDRAKTLTLVRHLGIPTPKWVQGESLTEVLEGAEQLRFPVSIQPRGPGLYRPIAHTLDFSVRYAESLGALARMLGPLQRDLRMLLIQECLTGVGHCVSAVCDQGQVVALFPCEWEREFPLTGGVSVVRRSIPLDPRLESITRRVLEAWAWHGVAMVEFRYDRRDDEYTFVGVSTRFPTSTALALEAGINLPHLAACLYTGKQLPAVRPHRVGVRERWLRGDLLALRDGLSRPKPRAPAQVPYARTTSFSLWGTFLKDLFRMAWSSEFRFSDPGPALVELGGLTRLIGGWIRDGVGGSLKQFGSWALTPRVPPLELKRQPPLPVQPREERVVPSGFEVGEKVGVVGFEEHPRPGSGEFALSGREG